MSQLIIHYFRPDGCYRGWSLWVWEHPTGANARAVQVTCVDAFGAVFVIDRGGAPQVGLLPFHPGSGRYDRPDRIWIETLGQEAWLRSGVPGIFSARPSTLPAVLRAYVDGRTRLTAALEYAVLFDLISSGLFELRHSSGRAVRILDVRCATESFAAEFVAEGGTDLPSGRASPHADREGAGRVQCVELVTSEELPHRESEAGRWRLELAGSNAVPLLVRDILQSFAIDDDLGAQAADGQTRFAVFAPGATQVSVELFARRRGPAECTVRLMPEAAGVWRCEVPRDLTGSYYRYRISGGDPEFGSKRIALDPYARCHTRHDGRSLVIADPEPLPPGPAFPLEDAVIYELSLRDFTIDPDSGVKDRGKYRGLAEWGTSLAGLATGLSHLWELGVNVIQIMPVCDFPNDEDDGAYNWGYMPAHFFCPDGWYATKTAGRERVEELRELVAALHARGFKVVFDVVYNHTCESEPNYTLNLGSLAPRYYYRYRRDGTPWNGSGCGNEFRSEAPMARRLILDSLRHFVTVFGADGFRFDLLPLIDAETIRLIASELRRLKPDMLLYGEPWAVGEAGTPLLSRQALAQLGFAFFDDGFRDALRGNVFGSAGGFLSAGTCGGALKRALRCEGIAPLSCIRYLECHDNHTLWDRLELVTRGEPRIGAEDRRAMVRMGMVLLLASPGIPFIHAGQEFLRSKGGADNSYDLPDEINMVRWRLKRENLDIYTYVKGLIEFRRRHGAVRIRDAGELDKSIIFLDDDLGLPVPDRSSAFLLRRGDRSDAFRELVVVANAAAEPQGFVLPGKRWQVLVDHERAGAEPLRRHAGAELTLPGRSAWVLAR